MKKLMTVAMVALFVAGSTTFACSGCGCSAKKDDAKKECSKDKSACSKDKASCSSEKKECSKKAECTKK